MAGVTFRVTPAIFYLSHQPLRALESKFTPILKSCRLSNLFPTAKIPNGRILHFPVRHTEIPDSILFVILNVFVIFTTEERTRHITIPIILAQKKMGVITIP